MNKTAIITGASRGIGLAIAKKIISEGYYAVMTGTKPEAGAVQDKIAAPDRCEYIKCDISDPDDRRALIEAVTARRGRLDLLVNNAGVAPLKRADILETDEESFERVLKINLQGTFFMSQLAARVMIAGIKAGHADYSPRIVNISSVSAYTSSVSRGEYCVSKAGISMVTNLFADRLAEYGIPVFEVRPGIIATDMTLPVIDKYNEMINAGLTPIRRIGRPEDVANCVSAACSGLLDFGTGTVLNADGGFHIRRL